MEKVVFWLDTTTELSIFIFIYEIVLLLTIFLHTNTNATINMTDFFNPTLAKLIFPFLQSRHSLSFQAIFSRPSQHRNLWKLDRFPLRRDWEWTSYGGGYGIKWCQKIFCWNLKWLLGERFIYLQLNNYLTAAYGWALSKELHQQNCFFRQSKFSTKFTITLQEM